MLHLMTQEQSVYDFDVILLHTKRADFRYIF